MKWMILTCEHCGGKFAGRYSRAPKYCSRTCNGKAQAKYLPENNKPPASLGELLQEMINEYAT